MIYISKTGLLNDLKFKVLYFFLSLFLLFLFVIDSWEYVISFDLNEIIQYNNILKKLISTHITDGQYLILVSCILYTFMLCFPIFLVFVSLMLIPALYTSEFFMIFAHFLAFFSSILLIFFGIHFIYLPLITRELLQYQFTDISLNVQINTMINIKDLIDYKFKFYIFGILFLAINNIFYYILNKNIIDFSVFLKYKVKFYFIFMFISCFFFEFEFYMLSFVCFSYFVLVEMCTFFIFVLKQYIMSNL